MNNKAEGRDAEAFSQLNDMKSNRRNFLKVYGLTGIGLASSNIIMGSPSGTKEDRSGNNLINDPVKEVK